MTPKASLIFLYNKEHAGSGQLHIPQRAIDPGRPEWWKLPLCRNGGLDLRSWAVSAEADPSLLDVWQVCGTCRSVLARSHPDISFAPAGSAAGRSSLDSLTAALLTSLAALPTVHPAALEAALRSVLEEPMHHITTHYDEWSECHWCRKVEDPKLPVTSAEQHEPDCKWLAALRLLGEAG